MTLRLPDSLAEVTADGRRHAPSAARNAAAIRAILAREAPAAGRALEIAAGTGQHAAIFASAFPGLVWQPTDISADNLVSISAWAAHLGAPIAPPQVLDAAQPGWSADWAAQHLVLIVNLLHLVTAEQAATILDEAARALAHSGKLMIYGPFLRDGAATSPGDLAFDADLRRQDPTIGYKDIAWVEGVLGECGLLCQTEMMPANNLMIIAARA